MFNPQYKLTNKIVALLTAIAESKAVIERAKILPQNEIKLRRQALIRMSHSSTEIEGNRLNLKQVEALVAHKKIDAPMRDIYEVENYFKALKYIDQFVQEKKPVTEKILLKIHRLVTDKTLPKEQSGYYRMEPIFVVRQRFGLPYETVYTGPDTKDVPRLCSDFIEWLQESEKEKVNPVIVAGIAHLEIAAIHPFNDGNGRTARAMATLILYQRGYDFRRLFALEDYYNTDRQAYYKAVNVGKTYAERRTDITSWLEYFVKGFKEEIDKVKSKILPLANCNINGKIKSQIYLTPDQLKIIDFIDQVGRISAKDVENILSSPKRTAQLQLQKLKKVKMIKAVGKGKSTSYIANT